MSKMLAQARGKFGEGACYTVQEHERTHYGVPLDNIALEYLLCSTVLPMERVYALSGPWGSGKSALGYDLMRRVVADGNGMGSLIETENKSAVDFMRSFMGSSADLIRVHRAKSMEDGQARFIHETGIYQAAVPNKDIPFILVLDSLVGNKALETVAKINKDGFADRSFSKEALIISSFFGALNDKLIGYPIMFVFTNHEKEKISDQPIYGSKIRNPGGAAPDFHSTYHIRCVKTGSFASKLDQGFAMKLTTKKCSMGSDKRSIEVDLKWRYEADAEGHATQISMFDWNKSTAELLAGDEVPRSVVKEIVQVTKVTNTKFNCPTLKLKEAPPDKVGAAIMEQPGICRDLRVALGIFTHRSEVGSAD